MPARPAARGPDGRFLASGNAKRPLGGRRAGLRAFVRSTVLLGALAFVGTTASDAVKDQLKGLFGTALSEVSEEFCGLREWWAHSFGTGSPAHRRTRPASASWWLACMATMER